MLGLWSSSKDDCGFSLAELCLDLLFPFLVSSSKGFSPENQMCSFRFSRPPWIMWPLLLILSLSLETYWLFLFVMTPPNLCWLCFTEVLSKPSNAVRNLLFSKWGINLIRFLWTNWNLLFPLFQWYLLFLHFEGVFVCFQPLSPCLRILFVSRRRRIGSLSGSSYAALPKSLSDGSRSSASLDHPLALPSGGSICSYYDNLTSLHSMELYRILQQHWTFQDSCFLFQY